MTFRPPGVTGTFRARAALSLALGAALLATSLPARAADDDVPIDRKIFGSILEGLGLRRDGEAINYQERPPLVIPPSRNLPPPETVQGLWHSVPRGRAPIKCQPEPENCFPSRMRKPDGRT